MENGTDARDAHLADVNRQITSYAVLNDDRVLCVAYYLREVPASTDVNVVLFRRNDGSWREGRICLDSMAIRPNSILGIHHTREFFFLDGHINPSAGLMIVLTNQLKYHDAVYGWFLDAFIDETVVYHNNQIHFAPTHHAEISLYSPATKSSRMIYPWKPYLPVTRAHIAKVNAAYERLGEAWGRIHNHHMNPELFNSSYNDDIVTNDSNHALAFSVALDNTECWSDVDRIKLEAFPELRSKLNGREPAAPLDNALFMSIHEDMARMTRLRQGDSVLALFSGDAELHAMIRTILEVQDARNDTPWRQYLVSRDPRWNDVNAWQRLARFIRLPEAEATNVLCVYRHVDDEAATECRELLPDDARRLCNGSTPSSCLEPAALDRVFGKN